VTQYTLGLTRLLGHGRAFTEVVSVTTPAANTGFTYGVSSYWEIIDSVSFQFVTDSNAGNRQVTLTVLDGSGVQLAAYPAASVQAASTTDHYNFQAGVSTFDTTVGGNSVSPMYLGLLQPGFSVTVAFTGGHAGDQISNIRLNIQRFVTGDSGYLLGVFDDDDPRFVAAVNAAALLA